MLLVVSNAKWEKPYLNKVKRDYENVHILYIKETYRSSFRSTDIIFFKNLSEMLYWLKILCSSLTILIHTSTRTSMSHYTLINIYFTPAIFKFNIFQSFYEIVFYVFYFNEPCRHQILNHWLVNEIMCLLYVHDGPSFDYFNFLKTVYRII